VDRAWMAAAEQSALSVTTDTMKQFFKSIVELSTDLREARVNVYSVGIGQFHVQFAGGGAIRIAIRSPPVEGPRRSLRPPTIPIRSTTFPI